MSNYFHKVNKTATIEGVNLIAFHTHLSDCRHLGIVGLMHHQGTCNELCNDKSVSVNALMHSEEVNA